MLSPLVDERQAPLRTDAKSKGRKISVLIEGSFEGGLCLCGEQQVLRKYGGVTSKPSSGMIKLYVFQRWGGLPMQRRATRKLLEFLGESQERD